MRKQTVESCLRLDINRLARRGIVRMYAREEGKLTWSHSGAQVEYLLDTTDVSRFLTLYYKSVSADKSYCLTIPLTLTTPRFGGERWWFLCPREECGQRVGVLYAHHGEFACRHCHRLVYESQYAMPHTRRLWRAQKLHQRLGGDGNMLWYRRPPKPKWMRWRTYRACVSHLEKLDDESIEGMKAHQARVMRQARRLQSAA